MPARGEGSPDDAHWMALALQAAQCSISEGEVPVGAVLVHRPVPGGPAQMLASSHNQPIHLHDPTAHAEMLALRHAAGLQGNYRLDECELYVTLEPCAMCAQAALHARLRRVVYGAAEPKTGAAGSVLNLFELPQLNHQTKVLGGVLAEPCGRLLTAFFQERRQAAKQVAQPLRDDALRTPEACFAPVWSVHADWAAASHYTQSTPALDRLRLHWLDLGGVSTQAPWLALHGPTAWWPQLSTWVQHRLAAGERVLLPDLIGFGQSDKPKKTQWHSLARHAAVLLSWLDELAVSQIRLAYAPGQDSLVAELRRQAPERIHELCPVSSAELVSMSADWLAVPFPDDGHRAAPKAWQQGGWVS